MADGPRMFYNFMGAPQVDETQYEDVRRERARYHRRIALMRRERQRFGSAPNRVPFSGSRWTGPEPQPDRVVPGSNNPGTALGNGPPAARGRAFSLLEPQPRSHDEKRKALVAPDASKPTVVEPVVERLDFQSRTIQKMKTTIETTEKFEVPQAMPYPAAQGSGPGPRSSASSGQVVLQGFVIKNEDNQDRILCTCHGVDHTPEEFLNHSRAIRKLSDSDTSCCVTVSFGP